jgi:hypothetical protein
VVGIKPDSWVSIETTDGRSLTVTPATEQDVERMAKVRDAIDKTNERFGGALKRLAEQSKLKSARRGG